MTQNLNTLADDQLSFGLDRNTPCSADNLGTSGLSILLRRKRHQDFPGLQKRVLSILGKRKIHRRAMAEKMKVSPAVKG